MCLYSKHLFCINTYTVKICVYTVKLLWLASFAQHFVVVFHVTLLSCLVHFLCLIVNCYIWIYYNLLILLTFGLLSFLGLFGHHWTCAAVDIIAAMDIIEFVFQFTNIHISVPLIPGRRPVALEPMQTFNFSRYFQKGSNRLHSLAVALHCCQCWCQPFHFCTPNGLPRWR